MKAEIFYLVTQEKMDEAVDTINNLEIGNKYKVTISNAGDKTSKQRGYQWRLYLDIANSGLGGEHEETAIKVDLKCKFLFGLAIFMRDDDFFRDLYLEYEKKYKDDTERMKWFVESQVHTEQFDTSQMAEYITMIINYYAPRGFELTDPAEYGLKR